MTDPTPTSDAGPIPRVVVLSSDLFFGMRIRNALRQMGYETVLTRGEDDFGAGLASAPAALALIDFNRDIDWELLSPTLAASDVPVIAFGPHTDTEGFRRAGEAGVTRVISNGAFSEKLPDLVERYARRAG